MRNSTECLVTARNSTKFRLKAMRDTGMTFRKIAKEIDSEGRISAAMVWRIINQDYEPKDNEIRTILGWPIIVYQLKDPRTGRFVKKDDQ